MKLTTALFGIVATALLTAAPGVADEVYSKTEAANRLYKQGKFEEALKLYSDALLLSPADPKLKMNKGSALFQTGDLEAAESNYMGALSAKEKKERAIAHYNLGNIQFRKGDQLMQQGDQKAQEQYKGALDNYIKSLDLNPSDFDAKWNLQLAHQRIKQMEQQQQQQQNQKNDKDQNKDQQDKQQQQQNKDNQQKNDEQDKQQQQSDKQQDEQKQDEQKQEQDKEQNKQDEKQQQQAQSAQKQDEKDMKKEEAKRIIELYADDADSLNKPPKTGIGKQQQPERDW